jgi:RND family efflux transporter MFP subunit
MKHYAYPTLLAVALLAACGDKPPAQTEEVRPVRYVTLGNHNLDSSQRFAGTVHARYETPLAFQVSGKVVAKLVNSGEPVKKGQALARLDAKDYALDQSAKSAQLAAAQSDLAQQETDLKRSHDLLAKQFISQAQYDRQLNGVNAARAKLKQAQAQLSASSNQTGYTVLTANADGVVSDITIEPGQVVSAGQPVAHLAAAGEREVAIQVPEQDLQAVKRASRFEVELWAGKQSFVGKLRELSATADPATRTYAARISITNPSDALQPGMTANVQLPQAAAHGTEQRLPLTALLDQGGQHYLWTIDKSSLKVSRSRVQVKAVGDSWASVAGAPPAGSLVVTAGVHLLRDGQRVSLLQN